MERKIIKLTFLLAVTIAFITYFFEAQKLRKLVELQRQTINLQDKVLQNTRKKLEQMERDFERSMQRKGMLRVELEQLQAKATQQVIVTAYTACPRETNNDPGNTASMRKPRKGIIAVSRDLFYSGWSFGKKVYIEGVGIYEIQDLMNERFEKRLDILLGTKKQAKQFGIRQTKAILLTDF